MGIRTQQAETEGDMNQQTPNTRHVPNRGRQALIKRNRDKSPTTEAGGQQTETASQEAQADRQVPRADTGAGKTQIPRKSDPGLKGRALGLAGLPESGERGEGTSPANPQHLGEESSICGRLISEVFHFSGISLPLRVGPGLRK